MPELPFVIVQIPRHQLLSWRLLRVILKEHKNIIIWLKEAHSLSFRQRDEEKDELPKEGKLSQQLGEVQRNLHEY